MECVIGGNVRDVGFAIGKISWVTVREKEKRLANEFFIAQTLKPKYNPFATISNMINKRYRIIFLDTKSTLKNNSDENEITDLVGNNLVVAESERVEDIYLAWDLFDQLLLPMLFLIRRSTDVDKRLTFQEFKDTLDSIENKRKSKSIRKRGQSVSVIEDDFVVVLSDSESPTSAPVSHTRIRSDSMVSLKSLDSCSQISMSDTDTLTNSSSQSTASQDKKQERKKSRGFGENYDDDDDSTFGYDDYKQPEPEEKSSVRTTIKRKSSVRESPVKVDLNFDPTDALAEYARVSLTVREHIKKLGTPKETPRITDTVYTNVERLRSISSQLESYFSTHASDQLLSKLKIQFKELKQIVDTQVDRNPLVKKIEEDKKRLEVERQKELKRLKAEQDEESSPVHQKQQQQMSKKSYVSNCDLKTIAVENEIAKETLNSLMTLEEDMNELYEIQKELNQQIKEQDPLIMDIISNVDEASRDIQKGRANLKSANTMHLLN
ncbi:hypothetical protein AKO1_001686 [Acrasis kona]|uniref:t-SNARE coiled-coil homology domain-containing protein n=1 Tax=Acrasis kona TaxID=1008807 RepID=A0AAW2Z9L1_9EUKA